MSSNLPPPVGVDAAPTALPPAVPRPVEDPPFTGWDVTKIGFLLFLVPAFIEPFVVVFAQKAFYPQLSFQDVSHKAWVLLGPQFVWFAIVAVYLIISAEHWFHDSLWRAIQWNWPREGWVFLIAIGIATVVLLQLLQHVLPVPKKGPFDDFFRRPADAYAFAIIGIGFGPFMEELFFRGFLYPVLARRLGVSMGVLLTAALFASIHIIEYKAWAPVFVVFLVGVITTFVRAKRHSVASSFIVHAIYNGIPIIATIIVSGGYRHLEKLTP